MKKLGIVFIVLLTSIQLSAQDASLPIHIGYYAPYGINPGLKIGTGFEIRQWENEKEQLRTLSWSPQIGFWSYRVYDNQIHQTLVADVTLDYRYYASSKKIYGLAAVGLGYHATLERSTLGVNLGTGEVTPTTITTHHFVPTATVGFGQDFNSSIGYYFKLFGGQRFNSTVGNDLFVGGELGITYYFNKN